jgi:hypothetical protein
MKGLIAAWEVIEVPQRDWNVSGGFSELSFQASGGHRVGN